MSRKSRIDVPGALHHIIARGIERRKIFQSKADYSDFLKRLGKMGAPVIYSHVILFMLIVICSA